MKRSGNLFFDIAWVDGVCCIDELAGRFGVDAMLLGTNAPLLEPVSALYKLKESSLRAGDLRRITRTNALRFLGRRAAR